MKSKKVSIPKPDMSFVLQNFRKSSFENQVAMAVHIATLCACFLPWASIEPLYGPAKYLNAFSGSSWLIGGIVFVLSLGAVLLFLDELLEKQWFRFSIPRATLLGVASVQSLLLQLCAWSVLRSVGEGYAGVEIRFGLASCFLLQVVALVAVYLQVKSSKKEETREFFQLPTHGKSGQSAANPHKK